LIYRTSDLWCVPLKSLIAYLDYPVFLFTFSVPLTVLKVKQPEHGHTLGTESGYSEVDFEMLEKFVIFFRS